MPKAGEKMTDAQGREWRFTQGGQWRLYDKGKPTDTLSRTAPTSAATPAAAPTAAAPGYAPTVSIAPNQTMSAGLSAAKADLDRQVALGEGNGGINQSQANFELERLRNVERQTEVSVDPAMKLDTPGELVNASGAIAKGQTTASTLLTNPNQSSDLGSSTMTIDPLTGQPTVKQELSQGNKDVLGGLQGNSVSASNVAGRLMNGGAFGSLMNPSANGQAAPQSNFENAVFQQLTRGFDRDKELERQKTSQRLADRGIGVGNEAYNTEMNRFDDSWNRRYDDARSQAVTQGTNTELSALPTLNSVGQSGFYAPNFQGFQAGDYNGVDMNNLFNTMQSTSLGRDQIASDEKMQQATIDAQKSLAGGGGGGGGGGGTAKPPKVQSPFTNKPPGS